MNDPLDAGSVSSPPPQTPPQTPSAVGTGGAPARKDPVQARFDQLTAQRHDALRALDESRQEVAMFRAELSQMKEQMSQFASRPAEPHDNGAALDFSGSWDRLPASDIYRLVQENPNDPAITTKAIDEIAKRRANEAVKVKADEFLAMQKKQAETQRYLQRVAIDFGPDTQNPQSEITQRARKYAAGFVKEYGPGCLETTPPLIHACYAMADREMKAEKLSETSTELDKYRAREKQQLAEQGVFAEAVEHDRKIKALRASGNKEEALRSHARRLLGIVEPEG